MRIRKTFIACGIALGLTATLTLSGCLGNGGISSGMVSSRWGSSSVAILDPSYGLFVQEYWHANSARYLIFNSKTNSQSFFVYPVLEGLAVAKSPRQGPWTLGPGEVLEVDAADLRSEGFDAEAWLGFASSDGEEIGMIAPPRREPTNTTSQRKIIRSSLNSNFYWDEVGKIWMEFDALSVVSGATYETTLHIGGDFQSITVWNSFGVGYEFPAATRISRLVSVSAPGLRLEQMGQVYNISPEYGAEPGATYEVQLKWEAPSVTEPSFTMMSGNAYVNVSSGSMYVFRLNFGILVTP